MMQDSLPKAKLQDVASVTGLPYYHIEKSTVAIGRSMKNDLVIRKITVSGKHAVIEKKPEGYFIIDLNSTNKTIVNGEELAPNQPWLLKAGDEISIDTFSFVFEMEKVEPPKPAPPPPPPIDPDDDATVLFTEDASMAGQPAPAPEPDGDETVFMADDDDDLEETQLADSGDETVFMSSSELAADQSVQPEPQVAPPTPPPPEPDGDETVLFDSNSLMEEPALTAAPEPDGDETIFMDGNDVAEADGQMAPEADSGMDEDLGATWDREAAQKAGQIKQIGNYRVVKLLGKGGFGSVWQALTKDNETVAVKVLNPDVLDNERAVRKFFHEAIILSRLNHPNICRFIDFFPHEGNYAIVMDFVRGSDLKDLLEEAKGPLDFETARHIASQSLDAFHYAHQQEVLHRDIKPENITMDQEGNARVMDFGIAKLSSTESHQTSLYMISPAYTAPERFDANKTELVDHRSDIYALGLVFYELFTGAHPFPTTNPAEMIFAHLNTVPKPPEEIVDIPSEMSDAICTALEKDPDDRFEDFGAFKMAMLGEAPLRAPDAFGAIELSGDSCKGGAAFLKMLAGIVKKHQKQARKITVGQAGNQVQIEIETLSGNTMRITREVS